MRPCDRPDIHAYFMGMAFAVSRRSTCLRRRCGAVLVKDNRILSTGYNGVPMSLAHCSENGCLREQLDIPSGKEHQICRAMHAEANSILQAAIFGTAIKGCTIYSTNNPCVWCAKSIIAVGIKKVYTIEDYPDDFAAALLEEAGIKNERLEMESLYDVMAADLLELDRMQGGGKEGWLRIRLRASRKE